MDFSFSYSIWKFYSCMRSWMFCIWRRWCCFVECFLNVLVVSLCLCFCSFSIWFLMVLVIMSFIIVMFLVWFNLWIWFIVCFLIVGFYYGFIMYIWDVVIKLRFILVVFKLSKKIVGLLGFLEWNVVNVVCCFLDVIDLFSFIKWNFIFVKGFFK